MLTFDGCDPGANPWVEKYFHDCVMDLRDGIGFTLGLFSIFVWLTAQLPQFISNMKNQSSEALSIWFLVEWFAGDTLNLLGCLIQGQQLPTTTILAAYFVLMDVIMLLQYIYYGALQARRKRLRAKTLSRRRQRHASMHHHGRDDSHQHAVALLQEPIPIAYPSETSSCVDSSAFPTPRVGDSFQASEFETPPTAGRTNIRTLTAAAAAGVSLVCVAALTLRTSSERPIPGRHLLGFPENGLRSDSGGAGNVANTGIGGVSTGAVRLGLAAAGAGLSAVGRHLAEALYPAALYGGSVHRHGGHGGDSGDGGGSGDVADGSSHCSFLNCDAALLAGTAMGYLSTCFYLASRISQIRKNLARKSTEGLSPVMFLLTISANMCTGVSIVLRLRTLEQLKEQLPWMCGTFGTIALDVTLFIQAMTLGHEEKVGGGHGHHHHHHHHHHSHTQGNGDHCLAQSHGHAHGNGCAAEGDCGWEGSGGGGKLADLETPLLGPVHQVDVGANAAAPKAAGADCGAIVRQT